MAVIIHVDTRNFSFVSLGRDYEEAASALLSRWEKHCEKWPGADRGYMQELLSDGGGADVYELDFGQAVERAD